MGLKLSAEALKKLVKALSRSDNADSDFYDPETYSQDIYNYMLEDFETPEGFDSDFASDLLEDVLGEAENLMQEGTIDDVIESIAQGEPDGWIQRLVELHGAGDDNATRAIEDTAIDALTHYRDNWLGFHSDDILEQGVNRVDGPADKIDVSMHDEWEDPSEYRSALWGSHKSGLTGEGRRTLNSMLEGLDDVMLSGDMDDHISSIRSGNPTDQVRDWMRGFSDYDFDIHDSMSTDSPMMDNDHARKLEEILSSYRDNWNGYNSSPKNESLGVLKSDGVAPAAPQGPTGVLADSLGYPKIPEGMDAQKLRDPIPGGWSGRRDMSGRFRQQQPQEQAFEDLLKQLGILHQY